MKKKFEISVFWFRRDLRLEDNIALHRALTSGRKVLLCYLFEPMLQSDLHYSQRHWNFVLKSLNYINEQLQAQNTRVIIAREDIFSFLEKLALHFEIKSLFTNNETGLQLTYQRDLQLERYCKLKGISWQTFNHNGVFRALKNRKQWLSLWTDYTNQAPLAFSAQNENFVSSESLDTVKCTPVDFKFTDEAQQQSGGRDYALKYLNSFIEIRHKTYNYHISKPELSRKSCSRLSPYIAWGVLSTREVFHRFSVLKKKNAHLRAFLSRLRWQAHFIQKFEMECEMGNRAHELFMRSFRHSRCRPRIEDFILCRGVTRRRGHSLLDHRGAFFHVEIFRPLHLSGGRFTRVPLLRIGQKEPPLRLKVSLRHCFLFDVQPPVLVIVHDV
ncbi:MAG: deoxyribodipyrimidine photo-lyase, partial [Flavobacteriaceae bacterium]